MGIVSESRQEAATPTWRKLEGVGEGVFGFGA